VVLLPEDMEAKYREVWNAATEVRQRAMAVEFWK
jgi:hypothetical protein